MTRTPTVLLPIFLLCLDLAAAARFEIHGRSTTWDDLEYSRRESVNSGSDDLQNGEDINYYSDILLGGKNFSVLIDTGSSDLYVGGSIPNSKSTGKSATVTYASGSSSGKVLTADLDFLGYHVKDQAFISDSAKDDGTGLIGLGPSVGSQVRDSLNSAAGDPVLDRIFKQNTTTPNYLTILLGRSDDPTDKFPGEITVGETISGFDSVTSQPKLPVTTVPSNNDGNQHWQIALEANGIIGPDGNPIENLTSIVDGKANLTAVLDSGFSLPQVPRSVSDAIYSRIPGSSFQTITRGIGNVWVIPCDYEVNITFKIGGQDYHVHPLDASLDWNQNGETICLGAFQPKTVDSDTYDLILGMSFLRNAYMLINFGDFVDGKSGKTADPYVQLLSTTSDLAEAHNDFVSVRLNGVDSTGGQTLLANITTSGPPDAKFSGSGDSGFTKYVKDHKWYFIGGAIGLAVLLLGLILICACTSRNRKKYMKGVPVGYGKADAYRQLGDAAPSGEDHYEYRPTGRY